MIHTWAGAGSSAVGVQSVKRSLPGVFQGSFVGSGLCLRSCRVGQVWTCRPGGDRECLLPGPPFSGPLVRCPLPGSVMTNQPLPRLRIP